MVWRDTTVRDDRGRFGLMGNESHSGIDELAILGLLDDRKLESDYEDRSDSTVERRMSGGRTRVFGIAGAFAVAALIGALPGGTSAPGQSKGTPGIATSSTACNCSGCECSNCC